LPGGVGRRPVLHSHQEVFMTNSSVRHSWKRNVINFDRWSDEAFGVYELTPRNYRHFFRFDIQPVGSEIRVFVLTQPDYGSSPDSFHVTRRCRDVSGRIYVDIDPARAPQTVPEALAWAVHWAEQTSEYIDRGRAIR
jgi:hypothetical protein